MKVIVPDIGDFKEVAVIEVLIAPGGTVAAEDSLLTLESDKATMEVPSPAGGKITAVHVKAGDKVSAGTHIADMEEAVAAAEVAPVAATPAAVTPQEVRTPDIGDFKQVAIIEVLIKQGDSVNAEDPLLTLESDKATMEVPAPFAGVVAEVLVKTGDKTGHGDLIARITPATGAPATVESAPPPAAAPPAAATPPKSRPAPLPPVVEAAGQSAKPHASPSVRKFARELGVGLSAVKGSGQRGRIVKSDVQAFVKTAMQQEAGGGGALPVVPPLDFSQFGSTEVHPLSRIRKLSAANLHRNWLVAPHVTQFEEADITDMEEFRKSLAEETKKEGYRMTPLAFFIRAAVKALKQFPEFNASLQGSECLVHKQYFNIGIAVDTPSGLMVPVLRDAARKGLTEIARELGELSARTREGKIKAADMQGGCFTISSLGGIGGSFFTPIINLPEVAIMGVSRSQMRPRWNGKEFVPRLMLPLSLSYDHRVIDGAQGARFMTYYAALLGDVRRLSL